MARPLRIEFPGAVYHVTSRGNARADIFTVSSDRHLFLDALEEVIKRFNWLCHAYCLMDNHYHLMIETPEGNLSRGMRHLNGIYTQAFNRRHGRVGHIFQGRFKAIVVEKERHLLELCRYVVLNPVRAGLAEKPEEWTWSSYAATAGFRNAPASLCVDWVLGHFGTNSDEAYARYRRFVADGMGAESPWTSVTGQIFLGSDAFLDTLREPVGEKAQMGEVPRRQRLMTRPLLTDLFSRTGKDKRSRNEAIRRAHLEFGYTLKEIAEQLDLHYTTVSKVMKDPGREK